MKQMSATSGFHISPLPGFLILKPYQEEEVDGIYISDNMKDKDSAGEVIAVGPSYTEYLENGTAVQHVSPAKLGDIVIYKNYGSQRYMDFISGKTIFFVKFHTDPRHSDVMGVLHK